MTRGISKTPEATNAKRVATRRRTDGNKNSFQYKKSRNRRCPGRAHWKGTSEATYRLFEGKRQHKDIIYKKLVERQGEICAICGKSETRKAGNSNGKKISKLSIDHDHKTGKVRGLLCHRCNSKLSVIDDIEFVVKARLYLEEDI